MKTDRFRALSPAMRRLLFLSQRVFLAVALLAIGGYLYVHREQLAASASPALLLPGAIAIAVFLVLHLVIVVSFYGVQRALGIPRGFVATLSSYLTRLPARYVPGGIWHSASRYLDVKLEHDATTALLGRIFLLESLAVVSTGFVIAGAWSLWLGLEGMNPSWLAQAMLAAGVVSMLALVVVAKRWIVGRGARWLVVSLLAMLVVWPCAALSFAQLATVVMEPQVSCSLSTLAVTHVAAANLGYVAIFAPQGWGVAEVAFAALAPCRVQLTHVLLAFVLFRICSMTADFVSFAGWWVAMRQSGGGMHRSGGRDKTEAAN